MMKTRGLPDLGGFLEENGRQLVTYGEGATMYSIPYYSFVRLAKEAGANITLRKNAVVDLEMVESYLEEHPEVALRIDQVRR